MAVKDVYNNNKLFHYRDKLKKIAAQEIVSPVNFQVDLTNRCNNKCLWCFYDVHHLPEMSRRDELTREQAMRVPVEFKATGGKSIEWTGGGEPTLHPDFADVVRETRQEGLHQALVTNGKRLSGEIRDEILDFDWVRVSLNAASAMTYKVEHGNNSFLKVTRNISEFAARKDESCVLGVSMIVDNKNYKEIAGMVALARMFGADNARISLPQTPEDDRLYKGIWAEILAQMERAREFATEDFAVFTNEHRLDTLAHKTKSGRCYYHHLTPSLGANGVVYPCCHFKYLPKYNLGNIKKMSFPEIWNGEKRKEFIRAVGESCDTSCWMNGKNTLSDYIIKNPEDVPHLEYP